MRRSDVRRCGTDHRRQKQQRRQELDCEPRTHLQDSMAYSGRANSRHREPAAILVLPRIRVAAMEATLLPIMNNVARVNRRRSCL